MNQELLLFSLQKQLNLLSIFRGSICCGAWGQFAVAKGDQFTVGRGGQFAWFFQDELDFLLKEIK
jgi:hypothetical protein